MSESDANEATPPAAAHRPTSPPGENAEDRPAYSSRLFKVWLEYLGKFHPQVAIDPILQNAGMTRFEVEDPGHWFNQRQVDRFYALVRQETADPQVAREAGRYLALSDTIGPARQLTLGLLNLKSVYTLMTSLSAIITRSAEVSTRSLGPNAVEIINTIRTGFTEKPYQCENRLGIYESIGKLFSDHYAEVKHSECLHHGGACCRYQVSWQPSPWTAWKRWRNWALVLGAVLLIATLPVMVWRDWLTLVLGWSALTSAIAFMSEHLRAREHAATIRTQGETASDHITAMNLHYNNALMVQEIGQITATLHNESQLLDAAAKIMRDRSEYDRGLFMLADCDTQRLHYAAGFGYDDATRGLLERTDFHLDRPESRGIFVKAFREKQPFLIQDMDDIVHDFSERSQALARQLAGKSLICVPMAYEEEKLGILAIDNTCSERALTQSDVSLLMGISSQLAVGIINIRAFRQLKHSEIKYRDLVENANSLILRIDPAGQIIFCNKFAKHLLGYHREEISGRAIAEVLAPDVPGDRDWHAMLARIAATGITAPPVEETVYRLGDGQRIWVAWTFQPILSETGTLKQVLCIGNDITQLMQTREEKTELESQLLRAQKMEALGTLAGGVAHDLNNVLAGLINYPELMLMRMPADSPLRRYVLAIQRSGENAAAIVQDLLTLARRNVAQPEVVNLNLIVADYLSSTGYQRLTQDNPDAVMVPCLEKDLANIQGMAVHLSKTVMNLATNAVEALEGEPGEVVIATANRQLDAAVAGYEHIPAGDYVILSVSDTGCGIAEDDIHRIFEPFFTKKQMGRSGTGLGMAVVWGAVKDHGALIDIRSIPGQGTTFDIYFPTTATPVQTIEEASAVSYGGCNETILVVDDVTTQRDIANEILTDLGYTVATVGSGEAAVEYVRNNPVDLLVLDMIMASGIDGLETYKQVLGHRPGQKAIIISGYSKNEKVREALRLGVGTYVKKPYSMELLGKAVRRELDRDPPPARHDVSR